MRERSAPSLTIPQLEVGVLVQLNDFALHVRWSRPLVFRAPVVASTGCPASSLRCRAGKFEYGSDGFSRVVFTESHDADAKGGTRVPTEIDPPSQTASSRRNARFSFSPHLAFRWSSRATGSSRRTGSLPISPPIVPMTPDIPTTGRSSNEPMAAWKAASPLLSRKPDQQNRGNRGGLRSQSGLWRLAEPRSHL
jgi:hypothetical protein